MLICYDVIFVYIVSQVGVDVFLVGDLFGMVLQGYDSILLVSNEEMVYYMVCVKCGNKGFLIVIDLVFEFSYFVVQIFVDVVCLMQVGVYMVKLEGGVWLVELIVCLVQMGVLVCVYFGLILQVVNLFGGFKVQGCQEIQVCQLCVDVIVLEQVGVVMLLLECVFSVLVEEIIQVVKILVIGIGVGVVIDGQVLVMYDMFGFLLIGCLFKFVKDFM